MTEAVGTSVLPEHQPDRASTDAAPRPRRDGLRTLARGIGQSLITLGLVALLFVVYQLWVTDLLAAEHQQELSHDVQQQWLDTPTVVAGTDPAPGTAPGTAPDPAPGTASPGSEPAPAPAPPTPAQPAPIRVGVGEPFAILHIPRLGTGWNRVVVEGTDGPQLEQGPGHYVDTAMPGQRGNFAVAGHRVGRGSPFLDLDRMRPGDAVVVETGDSWFVYRVLGDPVSGRVDTDPSGIPGRVIVRPSQRSVIAPTPGGGPATEAYLTLTTCHPRYSAQQRLIIHARLDGAPISKADFPDGPPALAG